MDSSAFSRRICMAAALLLGLGACSRSHHVATGLSSVRSLYDSSSLVEVRCLSGLPAEIQSLFGAQDGAGPELPPRRFLVSGVGKTSALVAYEEAGDPTSSVAVAYVLAGSQWIAVAHWSVGSPNSLRQLRAMTLFPPDMLRY
jgi:hypothetical protein